MGIIKNFVYTVYVTIASFFVNRAGVVILMYHRVLDDCPPSELIISSKKFLEQMEYLEKYCEVISLQNLCDRYQKKVFSRRRKPQVVITLDDGYRDNYLNAFPILKKLGLAATIFLATGFIDTDKKFERYQQRSSPDMLNWQEVRTMHEQNVSFCPHTANHPHLSALQTKEQEVEIQRSMEDVSANVPSSREHFMFAYPYGQYNEQTLKILKDLGVKIAVTVQEGMNQADTDPLQLKRVSVNGQGELKDFIKKLAQNIQLI